MEELDPDRLSKYKKSRFEEILELTNKKPAKKKKVVMPTFTEELEDEEKALTLNEEESEVAYRNAVKKYYQMYPMSSRTQYLYWAGPERKPRALVFMKPKRLFDAC